MGKNYKLKKSNRQKARSINEMGGQISSPSLEPSRNEIMIARSRGFRYGVTVALISTPEQFLGTVIMVRNNRAQNAGYCRIRVREQRGGTKDYKPSSLVVYTQKAQG